MNDPMQLTYPPCQRDAVKRVETVIDFIGIAAHKRYTLTNNL